MTILFITAFPPNQNTAGQDYTRRLLDDLVRRGHSVSLVYASYPGHETEVDSRVKILSRIRPHLKNCLSHPRFHPFFTRRFSRETLLLVQSCAAQFDMLYFDFSQVHLYALFVDHPCKILMCHDVIAQKFSRKHSLHLPWVRNSERMLLSSASKIVTFSSKDCRFIRQTYGLDSVAVNFYLKNGHFSYSGANTDVRAHTFCFYGAWNRDENAESLAWFLKKVLPNVPETLRFVVIGGGMSEKLKRKIASLPAVQCIGFVEDPVAEIARCQALVAPLRRGAGVKVKVIDALSSGTSVIDTEVAFEGIEDNTTCRLFCKADRAEDFVRILGEWRSVSPADKQAAADEFFARYNGGHLVDML